MSQPSPSRGLPSTQSLRSKGPNMSNWTRVAVLCLGVLGACGTDSQRRASENVRVDFSDNLTAETAVTQAARALRTLQKAPGYEFVADGAALRAPMGKASERARVRVMGERVELTPEQGDFTLGIRTLHVGRQGALKG